VPQTADHVTLNGRFGSGAMTASGRVLLNRVNESSRSFTKTKQRLVSAGQQPFISLGCNGGNGRKAEARPHFDLLPLLAGLSR